ncbi:MAG: hypothetical protein PHG97_06075 [Candidatus Margulisbacteria bacterium]|nr:hypothetical protein [Candidatus Margulisiibacteriota bacterium]
MLSALTLQAKPFGGFRVSYTKRPAGQRKLIARGDEATVTRLVGGEYNGMVERLQHSNQDRFKADLFYSFCNSIPGRLPTGLLPIPYYRPEKFVVNFFQLAFSKLIFPDNFINVTEMKLQRTKSGLLTSFYSDYIQIREDTIQQRRQNYHQYYAPTGERLPKGLSSDQAEITIQKCRRDPRKRSEDEILAKKLLATSADGQEYEKEPTLLSKFDEISKAGIFVVHPSMNYGIDHNGNIVFFEIESISLNQAVKEANNSKQRNEAIGLLAMSLAIALKGAAHLEKAVQNDWYSEYHNIEVQDLYEATLCLLTVEKAERHLPTILKDPFGFDWAGLIKPIDYKEWSRHVKEKSSLDIGQFPRFSIDPQIFAIF